MAVSITQVATRAGVSKSTVSRVLNDKPGTSISADARDRVYRAARELDYFPSATARALSRKRSGMIGLVVFSLLSGGAAFQHPFFTALLNGVVFAAAERKINTIIYAGHDDCDLQNNLDQFRDGRSDGLILFYHPARSCLIPALLDANLPIVLLNDRRDDPRLTWIDIDNRRAIRDMTEYLIGLGHRRIALFNGQGDEESYISLRLQGYRETLAAHGIEFRPEWVSSEAHPWAPEVFRRSVERMMDRPSDARPTAILCSNDHNALMLMSFLSGLGLRVPDDVSVVGFNDDPGSLHQSPPLTTIRQPYAELGETAVRMLLEQIEGGQPSGRHVVFPGEAVIRESTAAPATR